MESLADGTFMDEVKMMEEEQRSDPDATIQTMLDGTASKHDAAADALRWVT